MQSLKYPMPGTFFCSFVADVLIPGKKMGEVRGTFELSKGAGLSGNGQKIGGTGKIKKKKTPSSLLVAGGRGALC